MNAATPPANDNHIDPHHCAKVLDFATAHLARTWDRSRERVVRAIGFYAWWIGEMAHDPDHADLPDVARELVLMLDVHAELARPEPRGNRIVAMVSARQRDMRRAGKI